MSAKSIARLFLLAALLSFVVLVVLAAFGALAHRHGLVDSAELPAPLDAL